MAKRETSAVQAPPPSKKSKGHGAPKKQLTGRQKAAIFIITLGHEIASDIFKHLRDDEI